VLVDGQERGRLSGGVVKIDVPVGTHTIEVRVPGSDVSSQQVTVAPGSDQDVTVTLAPAKTETAPVVVKSNLPIRKIAAYSALGLGGVAIVLGVVEGVRFLGDQSDLNNDRGQVSSNVKDVCADKSTLPSIDACNKANDGHKALTLELVGFGAGAVLVAAGVYLLVTDKGTEEAPPAGAPPRTTWRVLPHVSPNSGGVDFALRF